jgi:poly(3-hydroxybutyrate) depolymerase
MSLDQTGYAYVPTSCSAGAFCKLVVFFHGCQQGYSTIGNVLVQNNGLNGWAESNNIVVLYPQATTSDFLPSNPEGCWDWWGYTNANYAIQSGPQIQTIMNMVAAIGSA